MSFSISIGDIDFLFGKKRVYGDRITLPEITNSFYDFPLEGNLLVFYKIGRFPITHFSSNERDRFCPFIKNFFNERDFDATKFIKMNPRGLRDISVYFSERPGEQLRRAILNYQIRAFQEQNV